MEKAPEGEGDAAAATGGSIEGPEPLTYKTWILRVSIHCGGCQKKVKKVLQSIEGVYKIEIDSKQHRVVVTGNVESGTLIKKLIKSGKNAELWPENQSNGGENKIDQADGSKTGCDSSGEDQAEEKGGGGGGAQPPPAQGGGKKKKKKKKKKSSNANAGGAPGGSAPGAAPQGGPVEQTNESSPRQQVISYPQFYYPTPEYGVSYNSAPQTASMGRGYYTMPRYSYAYYGPDSYLPSDSIIDLNHDDTSCSIT